MSYKSKDPNNALRFFRHLTGIADEKFYDYADQQNLISKE